MDKDALLDKAMKMVEESSISPARKKMLAERLPFLDPLLLELFVRICVNNEEALGSVLESLEEKTKAGGDLEKMKKIVEREKKEISEVLKI